MPTPPSGAVGSPPPADPGAEQAQPENVSGANGRPAPELDRAPAATAGADGRSDTPHQAPAAQGADEARPESASAANGRPAPDLNRTSAATAATDGRSDTPYQAPAAQGADEARPSASEPAGPDQPPAEPATAPAHAPAEHAPATAPTTSPDQAPAEPPAAPAHTPAEGGSASPGRAALAAAAPSGADDDLDAEPPAPLPMSFEELYETAHTRLVQQVFLLTACRHRAVHCVRRAFGEARRCWGAVAASGSPEGWVRVRACELALSPWHRGGPRRAHAWGLPHRRIKVRPADEAQAVLPDHDRLTDRDRALLKALKRLSRPQRRALVLHDGLGLPAAEVAVEVESTRAAAEGRVWAARAALARWVPDLVGPDPAAPGFADGLSALLHRAAVRGCPEPHRTPVAVLRARHRLWTASRTGAAALLTVAVGGATLATLAGVRPAVLFRPAAPPVPALCRPAPGVEPVEPGVPLAPGGAPYGIASLWCSPAPGLEAVLVEPRPQAAARWELPAAARGAAPPPQGPVVCRLWSPLPCTTGPKVP
ncbi:hypothetical protein ABZW03_12685 [Kitasatospora sp. NPDC004799]|uniref:hypothetical protein n=1 Tax=Kitasatospora sp. NPDC004799 TaxID=3154460 RepID=UPI0033A34D50